jgi:hypothetical protein
MAASGVPLSGYSDMWALTGPAVLHGPGDFPNEASERRYITEFFLKGTMNLDGGKRAEDYIMKDDGSTAANALPGAVRSTEMPQVMAQVSADWRLTEDYIQVNHIIRAINEGGGSTEARYHQFKSEQKKEEKRLATSYCNKFETDWFAQPNSSTMDGAATVGAIDPYPFWTFVNEYGADGTIYDSVDASMPQGTGLPNGFTTICGINPTTNKWYRPWQIPYGADGDITTTTVNPAGHSWISGMTRLMTLTGYGPLPWRAGEATQNDPGYSSDYIMPVSTNGRAFVHKLSISNHQFFQSPKANDPFFGQLYFNGIPIVAHPGMDKAAVYPTSSHTAPVFGAGVVETAADIAGPRFPLLSREHIAWFFHSKFNFYFWPEKNPARQWDTTIYPISTLHNRICRSRRKMGILYPSADIVVA